MKIKLVVLLVLAVLTTGCLSTRKFEKIITNHYIEDFNLMESDVEPDYPSVQINSEIPKMNFLVRAKTTENSVIPLIVFSSWNKTIEATLNARIFNQSFNNALEEAYNDDLGEILADKELTLTFNNIPDQVTYNENGNYFFLLLAYTYSYNKTLIAQDSLEASFVLAENGEVINEGIITVPIVFNSEVNINYGNKKYFEESLNARGEHIKAAINEFIIKLIDQVDI